MCDIACGSFDSQIVYWTSKDTANIGQWSAENQVLTYKKSVHYSLRRGLLGTVNSYRNLSSFHSEFMVDNTQWEFAVWLRSFWYTSVIRFLRKSNRIELSYLRLNAKTYSGMEETEQGQECFSVIKYGWNELDIVLQKQNILVSLNGQRVLDMLDMERPLDPERIFFKTDLDGLRIRNIYFRCEQQVPPNKPKECRNGLFYVSFATDPQKADFFSNRESWSISKRGYGTQQAHGIKQSWLHCFEKNGEVNARVLCGMPLKDASCGVFARLAVEGSFLRAGYDFQKQAWFISACAGMRFETQCSFSQRLAPMQPGQYYAIRLVFHGRSAQLFVNDAYAVQIENLENTMYGRMGLFAQNSDFFATEFSCTGNPIKGVTEQTLGAGSHMDILRLDTHTLLGVYAPNNIYISEDIGLHFAPAPKIYDGLAPGDSYPSVFQCKNGRYIQLITKKKFLIQASYDLKKWTDFGYVLPEKRMNDDKGRNLAIAHISSFTEITMPDGNTRLFLPVGFRVYKGNAVAGHYTDVFYSDDGGSHWQESKNDVRDLEILKPWHGNMSWCESKIIPCDDGRLRMYCSRMLAPCMHYADSFDGGQTWSAYGEIPRMPCATSSFAVCEDPCKLGRYYMVYVKGTPIFASTIFPRTRLVLAVTENGRDFTELMDIERFGSPGGADVSEMYQILDPKILVCEDYIFVSYGRSDDVGDIHHHGQKIRFVRIDRTEM